MRLLSLYSAIMLSIVAITGQVAQAQITEERLTEMRRVADAEGWTFLVGANAATERPVSALCGARTLDENEASRQNDTAGGIEEGGPRESLPESHDWRALGMIPDIRDQGIECGSCWAHTAIGLLESALLIAGAVSPDIDLSEQWLINCTDTGSCSGGDLSDALDALKWHPDADHGAVMYGAVMEQDCPYTGTNEDCGGPYCHPYAVDAYFNAGTSIEQLKQSIYDHGPVGIALQVFESFVAYNGGVYSVNWGIHVENHNVMLVGWDDTQGSSGVWFLRNSWGDDWGEDENGIPWTDPAAEGGGYMRIEYETLSDILIAGKTPRYVQCIWEDPSGSYWSFDEGSGETAHDSVGGHDGTIHGATWTDGVVSNALDFDGDDYVELPQTVVIRDELPKSMCAWVYIDVWNRGAGILEWNAEEEASILRLGSSGSIVAGAINAGQEPYYAFISGSVCPTQEWVHICCVDRCWGTSIYVNGEEQTAWEDWVSMPPQGAYIGAGFSGKIDEVRIYAYELSEDEIRALADTTPPSPNRMTWAVEPNATGSASISMTATTASDPSGVEYYFHGYGSAPDSWQDSPTYEPTGLTPCTKYWYRVKARDKSPNQNETDYSTTVSTKTHFPENCPGYNDWLEFEQPDCWCCESKRQCHGDADGKKQGSDKTGYHYVGTTDLNVFLAAWQVKEPPHGPGILSVEDGICADFDHLQQGSEKTGIMRVSTNDLNILLTYWLVKEPPFGEGVPADCLDCGERAMGGGPGATFEDIVKWVESVWLDPEIRAGLDEKAWWRFIESLEEYAKKMIISREE